MNTLMSKTEQEVFLKENVNLTTLQAKWSCRGEGYVKMLDRDDNKLSRAGGGGYDRWGTCLGNFISDTFSKEVLKLAQRFRAPVNDQRYVTSKEFYGLSYSRKEKLARLDGACGSECMNKILNAIGFELKCIKESNGRAMSGTDIFELVPLSAHNRKYIVKPIN